LTFALPDNLNVSTGEDTVLGRWDSWNPPPSLFQTEGEGMFDIITWITKLSDALDIPVTNPKMLHAGIAKAGHYAMAFNSFRVYTYIVKWLTPRGLDIWQDANSERERGENFTRFVIYGLIGSLGRKCAEDLQCGALSRLLEHARGRYVHSENSKFGYRQEDMRKVR